MGKKTRRRFTREFKLDAVRLVTQGGHEVPQVARDLGIRAEMLRRWKRQLEEEAEQAFLGEGRMKSQEEELRRVRRELERTRQERDILKKAVAIFSEPRR